MSKTIEENKLTIIKKTFVRIQFYWEFMCTNESNNENKKNLPIPPSTSVRVRLNC